MQKRSNFKLRFPSSFFQPSYNLPVLDIPNNPAMNGNEDLSELHSSTMEPMLPVLDIPNNPAMNGNEDLSELHSSTIEPMLPVLDIPNNPAINGSEDLSELYSSTTAFVPGY